MNKNHLLTCIALASVVAPAQADYLVDIQAELTSSSGENEYDNYGDTDIDTSGYSLSGTIFFDRVSTQNVPIREAAFLSKKSSVTLGISDLNTEYDDEDVGKYETDTDEVGISGRFVIPGANIILLAGYSTGELDFDYTYGFDTDTYLVGAGWYITDNSSLTLSYSETEFDWQGPFDADIEDSDQIDINYHQVLNTGGDKNLAFSVYASFYDDGYDYDSFTLGANIAWYMNHHFGAGVKLESISGEGDDYEDYSFEVSPFISYDISENFGFYGELNFIAGELDDDDDFDYEYVSAGITVGANARF